ncbi:MAG: hypothetical protein MUE82_07815 [Chloroflexi bacterium]|nr:hypothetical protein [Chloroflexota bacterium]
MNDAASPGTAISNQTWHVIMPVQSGVKYAFWYLVHVPYGTAGNEGGVSTATRLS